VSVRKNYSERLGKIKFQKLQMGDRGDYTAGQICWYLKHVISSQQPKANSPNLQEVSRTHTRTKWRIFSNCVVGEKLKSEKIFRIFIVKCSTYSRIEHFFNIANNLQLWSHFGH